MPYSIRLPDGTLVDNIPDEVTPQQAKSRIVAQYPQFAPPEDSSFLRQAADIPLGVAKGLYGGAEMISNLFGAESEVSQNLRGVQGYLNSLMSAQARMDQQEIARIMKDAEDKGVADQVLAGVKAFATAPIDTMTQALGTTAPALIGGLATTLLGAPAAIGIGVGAGIGSMMGAGTVKGTIYEETKQTLLDAGMSPDQAEARAVLAQEFGGKNLDQILAGAALGGIASATGLEKSLIGPVAKRIIGKAAAEDAAAEAVKRGLVSRAGRGAAAEAAPEFAQAAQEQLAANIAAQREGIDVPTMRGVISSGTLEALAGAPLGGLGGALEGGPRAAKPEEEVTTTETPPQEQVIATFPSVGDAGQLIGISVVRTPDGEIIARSPDGEEVNVGNIVDDPNDPAQIQAAVEDTFGAPPPTTEPEVVAPPETAPVGAAPVEPVTQAAPESVRPEPPSGPAIPLAEQVRPEEPMRPVPLMAPETIPEEDITGLERRKPVEPPKTVPKTEEEKALDIQRKELEKERRSLAAPKLRNNLFSMLRGRLNLDFLKGYDIPQQRLDDLKFTKPTEIDKEPPKPGQKPKAPQVPPVTKAENIEDLVTRGSLDAFLPPQLRMSGNIGSDVDLLDREQKAIDVIREKLESENPLTFEAEEELRLLDRTLDQLEQELTLDQINAELEAIAAEERAAGIETIAPPAEERGAPGAEGPPAVEAAPEVAPEVAAPPAPVAAPEVTKEAPPETTFPGMPEEPKYQIDKSPEQIYSDLKAYGNLSGVADWAVKNAPNPLAKAIAEKVSARIDELSQAGIPMKFKVVTGSAMNKGNAGYVVLRGGEPGFEMKLQLNGPVTDKTPPGAVSGMTYDTVLHELIHAATTLQINMLGKTDPIVKDLTNLYNQVGQRMRQDRANKVQHPALEKYSRSNMMQNPSEILAWGLTDKDFQDYLKGIQLEKKQTAFSKMVQIVRKMLGLTGEYQTAIESLVEINERLTTEDIGKIRSGLQAINRDLKGLPIGMRRYKMQTYLFSKSGADASSEERGKVALNVIEELGRAPQPETTKTEWVKSAINDAVENPKVTAENAKARAKKFLDMLETKAFSSDAALNNQIRRSLQDSFKDNPEAMGTLLQISTSQAVHDDALANQFMQMGGLEYDPEVYKYKSVQKKENLKALVEQLVKISDKYGLTQEQAQRVAHTAFEAKRLSSLKQFNDELKLKIDALRKDARNLPTESGRAAARAEIRRQTKNFKYIHMTDGQIAAGLNLFNTIPELTDLVDTWNGMRENAVKELVDSGLWSREGAESMLENVDYVPFYREEQLEKNEGPKEFLRSYLVQAREKKLKGSDKPVNDIFDNMARWTQYAIKRAVRNRQALAMVDAAVDAGIAKEVKSRADGKNVIRVWREGEEVFYDMADPLFMEAFKGLESVAMPGWKFMAKMSNLLRQTVVLYPLFSVSQVPQDSFAAMFTSGLKPRQALKIPFLAVKEFVATIANRSKIHEQLKKYGAVGVKDFSAAIARNDAEIMAGLKGDRKFWGKVKDMLEHISMASDNAVRQAVYSAAKSQGLSEAEAVEKAFQLINFRNKGSSKRIAMAGQVIPFFNAYLAAQHVALKTLSGRGISPQVREDALKTLVVTTASVVTLSILYSMMVGGDDDYEDTPKAIRDRTFMVPGTGLRIPIRTDVFALPKILTENLYMLMTDKGSMDGRKFRDSMGSAVFNAVASPTVVPQAFKPALEVFLNYNFFQQRPLIGTYQKGLETSRQFNDNTSEFAKVLGQTGAISPIAADHLIRGMFGSAGGLFLAVTNPIIDSGTEVKAPSMDLHDMIAALPGTSAFVARPNQNALKADFYVLRDEVSKVVNTLNDLKARSPGDIDKFLEDEDNINKLGLQKAVNKITQQLSKIRREISRINNATDMSPAEKKAAIQEMRDIEKDMLKDLDIKELRKMANL